MCRASPVSARANFYLAYRTVILLVPRSCGTKSGTFFFVIPFLVQVALQYTILFTISSASYLSPLISYFPRRLTATGDRPPAGSSRRCYFASALGEPMRNAGQWSTLFNALNHFSLKFQQKQLINKNSKLNTFFNAQNHFTLTFLRKINKCTYKW